MRILRAARSHGREQDGQYPHSRQEHRRIFQDSDITAKREDGESIGLLTDKVLTLRFLWLDPALIAVAGCFDAFDETNMGITF